MLDSMILTNEGRSYVIDDSSVEESAAEMRCCSKQYMQLRIKCPFKETLAWRYILLLTVMETDTNIRNNQVVTETWSLMFSLSSS